MSDTLAPDSIEAVEPSQWNHLFPGELEDWSCLHAIERAQWPGFRFVYFAVREGTRLLAAVPAFRTDYRLDTTVSGALKRVTEATARLLPWYKHRNRLLHGVFARVDKLARFEEPAQCA